MVVQEINEDLSDFKVIKYKDIEFPDYMINSDGTKVYNLNKKCFITVSSNSHRPRFVKLKDDKGRWGSYNISKLICFTFEYDNIDLSKCKPLYYKYKQYPRYLINDDGTLLYDTKTKDVVKSSKFRRNKNINSKATYYMRVNIYLDNDVKKNIGIHQLVKWTFTGGPEIELKNPVDPTVDHIDGNGLNNNINNLQWLERGANTRKGTKGSNNGRAIISENIARKICVELKLANVSTSRLDIANKFNVGFSVVNEIYRGRSWRAISMQYIPFPYRDKKIKLLKGE